MKKIIALLLIVSMALTIMGCTKTETTKPTEHDLKESTEIDKEISELDKLNNELNTSELDTLEQDLEKVNW